jgi:hypothetical protein
MTNQRINDPFVKHELRIAVDTVRNPLKGVFLGGPTADQAEKILRHYGYSDADIAKLRR